MKKNKGFTLVEVIVILVILAIMAAVLVPSLTTWIDKAKQKNVTANARGAYIAAQALLSEYYGTHNDFAAVESETEIDGVFDTLDGDGDGVVTDDEMDTAGYTVYIAKDTLLALAQLDTVGSDGAPVVNVGEIDIAFDASANITKFIYNETVNGHLYTCTWAAGNWGVTKS